MIRNIRLNNVEILGCWNAICQGYYSNHYCANTCLLLCYSWEAITCSKSKMFSGFPSIPFLWTQYLSNAWREFLQIWHTHPLGLEDELIWIWWSKISHIDLGAFTSPERLEEISQIWDKMFCIYWASGDCRHTMWWICPLNAVYK